MKNILFLVILFSCSAPKTEHLKHDDQKILDALHEEPMRMGTKTVETENNITTEIWTYSEAHGSSDNVVETLLYKNGKLISHTINDSASKHIFSRQYRKDKVVEASESKGEKRSILFFDENEKLIGRVNLGGKKDECFVYDKGSNPHEKAIDTCDKKFNTAP